jgi:hypothetical protein
MLEEIRRLDPVKDHQRISFIDAFYEFPWDTTRSLEFALLRTFAVPRSAKLLADTHEFTERTQRRYDDTTLILSEVLENGYDSERGRAALRRMNRQHGHYPISNEEFVYVLSTFIYEPIRWNARFGWRPLLAREKLASFYYWRAMAHFMNIRDVPTSYTAFEQWNRDYEAENFRYAPENQHLAEITEQMLLRWYMPPQLFPLGRPVLHAFMDPLMLKAFGFPEPGPGLRRLVDLAMRARGAVVRQLPERRKPHLFTTSRTPRSYPQGYEIAHLGPIP